MEPQRSTMGSPFTALLIGCVAPVSPVSSGRALLASGVMGMRGGEGAWRPDGDMW